MKILRIFNSYMTPGGEDQSVADDMQMLKLEGHESDLWQVSNNSIQARNQLSIGIGAIWSRSAAAELRLKLAAKRYDVVHVHNYFPLLSPVVHRVAAASGVATVQHFHNVRHVCVNSNFYRNGAACSDCGQSFAPWRGVLRGCYRESKAASFVPFAVIGLHKSIGTFSRHVDAFVANSNYVRLVHCEAGYPADRIHVRYNTTNVQVPGISHKARSRSIVLPSRLSTDKGIDIAIAAWRRRDRKATLHIAGSGPEEGRLRALAKDDPSIIFEGQMQHDDLLTLIARSRAALNCSICAEAFGRTPMEAFAVGTPAIVARIGGLPEIVDHWRDGLHFQPGDINGLDEAFTTMLNDDGLHRQMCLAAKAKFASKFAPSIIAADMTAIYEKAIARRQQMMSRR